MPKRHRKKKDNEGSENHSRSKKHRKSKKSSKDEANGLQQLPANSVISEAASAEAEAGPSTSSVATSTTTSLQFGDVQDASSLRDDLLKYIDSGPIPQDPTPLSPENSEVSQGSLLVSGQKTPAFDDTASSSKESVSNSQVNASVPQNPVAPLPKNASLPQDPVALLSENAAVPQDPVAFLPQDAVIPQDPAPVIQAYALVQPDSKQNLENPQTPFLITEQTLALAINSALLSKEFSSNKRSSQFTLDGTIIIATRKASSSTTPRGAGDAPATPRGAEENSSLPAAVPQEAVDSARRGRGIIIRSCIRSLPSDFIARNLRALKRRQRDPSKGPEPKRSSRSHPDEDPREGNQHQLLAEPHIENVENVEQPEALLLENEALSRESEESSDQQQLLAERDVESMETEKKEEASALGNEAGQSEETDTETEKIFHTTNSGVLHDTMETAQRYEPISPVQEEGNVFLQCDSHSYISQRSILPQRATSVEMETDQLYQTGTVPFTTEESSSDVSDDSLKCHIDSDSSHGIVSDEEGTTSSFFWNPEETTSEAAINLSTRQIRTAPPSPTRREPRYDPFNVPEFMQPAHRPLQAQYQARARDSSRNEVSRAMFGHQPLGGNEPRFPPRFPPSALDSAEFRRQNFDIIQATRARLLRAVEDMQNSRSRDINRAGGPSRPTAAYATSTSSNRCPSAVVRSMEASDEELRSMGANQSNVRTSTGHILPQEHYNNDLGLVPSPANVLPLPSFGSSGLFASASHTTGGTATHFPNVSPLTFQFSPLSTGVPPTRSHHSPHFRPVVPILPPYPSPWGFVPFLSMLTQPPTQSFLSQSLFTMNPFRAFQGTGVPLPRGLLPSLPGNDLTLIDFFRFTHELTQARSSYASSGNPIQNNSFRSSIGIRQPQLRSRIPVPDLRDTHVSNLYVDFHPTPTTSRVVQPQLGSAVATSHRTLFPPGNVSQPQFMAAQPPVREIPPVQHYPYHRTQPFVYGNENASNNVYRVPSSSNVMSQPPALTSRQDNVLYSNESQQPTGSEDLCTSARGISPGVQTQSSAVEITNDDPHPPANNEFSEHEVGNSSWDDELVIMDAIAQADECEIICESWNIPQVDGPRPLDTPMNKEDDPDLTIDLDDVDMLSVDFSGDLPSDTNDHDYDGDGDSTISNTQDIPAPNLELGALEEDLEEWESVRFEAHLNDLDPFQTEGNRDQACNRLRDGNSSTAEASIVGPGAATCSTAEIETDTIRQLRALASQLAQVPIPSLRTPQSAGPTPGTSHRQRTGGRRSLAETDPLLHGILDSLFSTMDDFHSPQSLGGRSTVARDVMDPLGLGVVPPGGSREDAMNFLRQASSVIAQFAMILPMYLVLRTHLPHVSRPMWSSWEGLSGERSSRETPTRGDFLSPDQISSLFSELREGNPRLYEHQSEGNQSDRFTHWPQHENKSKPCQSSSSTAARSTASSSETRREQPSDPKVSPSPSLDYSGSLSFLMEAFERTHFAHNSRLAARNHCNMSTQTSSTASSRAHAVPESTRSVPTTTQQRLDLEIPPTKSGANSGDTQGSVARGTGATNEGQNAEVSDSNDEASRIPDVHIDCIVAPPRVEFNRNSSRCAETGSLRDIQFWLNDISRGGGVRPRWTNTNQPTSTARMSATDYFGIDDSDNANVFPPSPEETDSDSSNTEEAREPPSSAGSGLWRSWRHKVELFTSPHADEAAQWADPRRVQRLRWRALGAAWAAASGSYARAFTRLAQQREDPPPWAPAPSLAVTNEAVGEYPMVRFVLQVALAFDCWCAARHAAQQVWSSAPWLQIDDDILMQMLPWESFVGDMSLRDAGDADENPPSPSKPTPEPMDLEEAEGEELLQTLEQSTSPGLSLELPADAEAHLQVAAWRMQQTCQLSEGHSRKRRHSTTENAEGTAEEPCPKKRARLQESEVVPESEEEVENCSTSKEISNSSSSIESHEETEIGNGEEEMDEEMNDIPTPGYQEPKQGDGKDEDK